MKYLLVVFMLLGSVKLMAEPGPGGEIENRAMLVKMLGGFTGFDADAYKALRASMAALLVEGHIDHFVTNAWGFEGGHVFCVELTKDPSLNLSRIKKTLDAIKPANQTIYEYHEVLSCVGDTSN